MAEKKTNEILEDQRKARQEFLNLKKMQQGEMYAGPKPSETATVLKTPWEKFKNFWHYSKWYVLSGIALTALIAVMVVQCVTKPVYDLMVVYFSYTVAIDDQTNSIADYLKPYCEDVNGDGEVNIQVVNCSVSQDNGSVTTRNTVLQKMQAIMVADKNALLFITDDESVTYFDGVSESLDGFFEENSVLLGEDFYAATNNETFGGLPEGLTLSCRKISGTVLEEQKDVENYRKAALNVIENIKKSENTK